MLFQTTPSVSLNDNKRTYIYGALYYPPGTELSIMHLLICLIFTTTLCSGYYEICVLKMRKQWEREVRHMLSG